MQNEYIDKKSCIFEKFSNLSSKENLYLEFNFFHLLKFDLYKRISKRVSKKKPTRSPSF